MNVNLLLRGPGASSLSSCVVCGADVPSGNGAKCGTMLDNKTAGFLLVELDIMSDGDVSTDSYICKLCLFFLTNTNKAWTIANDNLEMLKERRDAKGQGSSKEGVRVSQGNGEHPSG